MRSLVLLNRHPSIPYRQLHASNSKYHIACFNIGLLKEPYEDGSNDEFRNALGPINALAQATPGFLWMYDEDVMNGSKIHLPKYFQDNPLLMPQLSLWEDYQSLRHFVMKSGHSSYLRRRREWFDSMEKPYSVCWYQKAFWEEKREHISKFEQSEMREREVQLKSIPTLDEALQRLELLKRNQCKNTPEAFKFGKDIPELPIDEGS